MKLVWSMILLCAGLLGQAAVVPAQAGEGAAIIPCSIYGTDDRLDYYEADKVMQKLAGSTAAMFKDSAIPYDEAAKTYKLKPLSLKDKQNLKPGEKFGDQTAGSFCSAALVGDDLMLTSGHCLKPDSRGGPCERVKFVFGYAVTAANGQSTAFPAADVYSCKEIVAQMVQDDVSSFACKGDTCKDGKVGPLGADFALVRLDRKVAGRYPLVVSRRPLTAGTKVTAIGYPSGLPVKIAGNGKVRKVTSDGYFVSDVDTFGGGSGGPVFNNVTFKIEGVLARGGVDYMYGTATPVADPMNPYEYESGQTNVYGQEEGRGEDVTFSSVFERLIPQTEMEKALEKMNQTGSQRKPQVTPAIYTPGTGGSIQPAIYYAPATSGPEPISI